MHAPVHVNTLVLDYNGLSVDCAILHLYLHVCLITEYCGMLNFMHYHACSGALRPGSRELRNNF